MSEITIKQYKQIVKFAARIKTEKNVTIPLFVWGQHATGKTSATRQVTIEDLGYHCVVLNLANQSPEELLGLPQVKNGKTVYAAPEWLIDDADKPTVYFLDEVNRAPKYVLQSMFNFINEGRLHTHTIGKRDIVIAAGNPNSAEYDVTDFNDAAFLSRFAHFIVNPMPDEVISYLTKVGCSNVVLDMIKEAPSMCDNSIDLAAQVKVKADWRMMERVGHILNYIDVPTFDEIGFALLAAMIGPDHAQIAETKWRQLNDMPNIEDVVSGKYDINKLDINRLDIIQTLNGAIVAYLETKGLLDPSKKFPVELKPPMLAYLKYIPKDSAVAFLKEFKFRKKEDRALDIFDGDMKFLFQLYEIEKKQAKKKE